MREQLAHTEQASAVRWVDIHHNPEALIEIGAELDNVRERLHVLDANGQLLVGDLALAHLWATTPRWRWLASLTQRLHWLSAPLYNLFAKCLYRWNRQRGHW